MNHQVLKIAIGSQIASFDTHSRWSCTQDDSNDGREGLEFNYEIMGPFSKFHPSILAVYSRELRMTAQPKTPNYKPSVLL